MTHLIVSFAGSGLGQLETPKEEFVNILNRLFPEHTKKFFVDELKYFYHKGITRYTTDIESTVAFLKDECAGYKSVTFLGCSAGGYAAILFGSLLKIDTVIAFIPQTIITNYKSGLQREYEDLSKHINPSTSYYIYGSLEEPYRSCHGKYHCDNISQYKNVSITMYERLNMKQLRDSGELQKILLRHCLT